MEVYFKYYEYVSEHSDYYKKPVRILSPEAGTAFEVNGLERDWIMNKEDSFWTMYHLSNKELIQQGFKIHVSTEYGSAKKTLELVSKLLLQLEIPFKHVKDGFALFNMYSKHGSRISAGKFITIYPTEEEFVELLDLLDEVLRDQPKGPYILTDKRWKDSNVFYRYGAFKDIRDAEGRHCIMDLDGNLVLDKREPKFQLPDFVNLPSKVEEQVECSRRKQLNVATPLKSYIIEKVIRFSNAGGIYVATRKNDGKKCVVKEARANIGLDSQNKTAAQRLQAEYDALSKLQGVAGVVQVVEYFVAWENTYLILEFVEGLSLYTWASANYPFSKRTDTGDYFNKVVHVIENLKEIIERMHGKGIAMCDLQFQNVMIDDELNVNIIDFEIAEGANNVSSQAMATRGFAHPLNTIAKDRDWYSLNRLLQFLLLPIGSVYDLDMRINVEHCLWIFDNFGEKAYDYFHNFQTSTFSKITNAEKIFLGTYEIAKLQIDKKEVKKKIDITNMFDKLKRGLLENCDPNSDSLINGDIRQFETDCGMLNLQNGGFGGILALHRLGCLTSDARAWIERQFPTLLKDQYNNGFFTGRSGIACVLYECGYKNEAIQIIEIVINSYDEKSKDITLRSGLSGIGIALSCIGKEENNQSYLNVAKKIARIVSDRVENNEEPIGTDWQSYGIGLLDGYSGVSLFLTLLYEATKNEKYLALSEMAIEKELGNARISDVDESLNLIDYKTNRGFPYLSNGSMGLGVAITALNYTNKAIYFEDDILAIIKSANHRISLEAGLTDGVSGFLLVNCFQKNAVILDETLCALNLFLIERSESLLMPGRMFLKLSSDLQTGVAGVILGLKSAMERRMLLWLPLLDKYIHDV
jgi:serine/threonine protein kinase